MKRFLFVFLCGVFLNAAPVGAQNCSALTFGPVGIGQKADLGIIIYDADAGVHKGCTVNGWKQLGGSGGGNTQWSYSGSVLNSTWTTVYTLPGGDNYTMLVQAFSKTFTEPYTTIAYFQNYFNGPDNTPSGPWYVKSGAIQIRLNGRDLQVHHSVGATYNIQVIGRKILSETEPFGGG